MKEFGNKKRFCFAVGSLTTGGLLQVDIWASNILLTPFDNMTYLPQFIASLTDELHDLAQRNFNEYLTYFNHGPTTDDVVGGIRLDGNVAKLIFEMEDSTCLVSINLNELCNIYSETIKYLRTIKV